MSRFKITSFVSLVFYLTLLLIIFMCSAAKATVKILPVEPWSTVFSEQEVAFHFNVSTISSFNGRVGWRVSTGGATIGRGEKQLNLKNKHPDIIEVSFTIPQVKSGIVREAVISLWAHEEQNSNSLVQIDKVLFIFPSEILVNDSQLLKEANIHLFDPNKQTTEIFKQANIPFVLVRNIETFFDIKEGILVIGEGLSLKSYRGLAPLLIEIVSTGATVLCLAPEDGLIPIPDVADSMEGKVGRIAAMSFRQADIIKELHPKLDSHMWSTGKISTRASFFVLSRGQNIAANINSDTNGWPWLELRFEKPDAIFLFCGFGIIENWHSSPTPRHLLSKILLYMLKK